MSAAPKPRPTAGATTGQATAPPAKRPAVTLSNASDAGAPLELLLLSGRPLGEPVVRYGPFVMTSESEIHQAIRDYQTGRMGQIAR